jgi:hypothetical protein
MIFINWLEKQKSAGNLLEIFPGGFESRKCNSLDRFLTTIQEKKEMTVWKILNLKS